MHSADVSDELSWPKQQRQQKFETNAYTSAPGMQGIKNRSCYSQCFNEGDVLKWFLEVRFLIKSGIWPRLFYANYEGDNMLQ